LGKEILGVFQRAIDKYAKRLMDLSNDPSLETTNEFFERDLTTFASELGSIKDKLLIPGQNDMQIREIIAEYVKPITMALRWYLNDLKQSAAIANHMLGVYIPEFKTLNNEIELVQETLNSPRFSDPYLVD
jgi:hypothetical protein